MMRIDTFTRSVAFAATVAVASLPWMVVTSPFLGTRVACSLYLLFSAVMYLAGVANGARSRWIGAAGLTCAVAALAAGSMTELAMALAGVIGVFRSGFIHRAGGSRAIFREVALIGGGLVFARALAATSLPPLAAGLWGFTLLQSFFFLPAAARLSGADPATTDSFDAAYRRAEELLSRSRP